MCVYPNRFATEMKTTNNNTFKSKRHVLEIELRVQGIGVCFREKKLKSIVIIVVINEKTRVDRFVVELRNYEILNNKKFATIVVKTHK